MSRKALIEWQGKAYTLVELAALTGLPLTTVRRRYQEMWTPYEIVTTPYKSQPGATHEPVNRDRLT